MIDWTRASSCRTMPVQVRMKQILMPYASGSRHQLPIAPKAKAVGGGYMEEARRKDVPKPVKDRMLAKFHQELYDNQLHHGRLRPSSCAPTPTGYQPMEMGIMPLPRIVD